MLFYKEKLNFKNIDFQNLDFIKVYDDRPTLYLDQNILDKIVKHPKLVSEGKFAGFNLQVVYSNETLNEIERSGYPDKFLKVLEDLKARIIIFETNQKFERTGHVVLKPYFNPFEVYYQYINRDPIDNIANNIVEQHLAFMFHILTKEKSQNIMQYVEASQNSLEELEAQVFEILDSVQDEISKGDYKAILNNVKCTFQELNNQSKVSQDQMIDSMVKSGIDINSSTGQEGINKFEQATGISGLELNNINPPNVLEKIYSLFKSRHDFSSISIYDFYLISQKLYGRELYNFEKVVNIYQMLNIIGYKRDRNFHKKYKRIISSQSDAQHLSYACYCNFFFSEDRTFIDKAKVIFEFLGIKTEATQVNFNINYG